MVVVIVVVLEMVIFFFMSSLVGTSVINSLREDLEPSHRSGQRQD